RHLQPLRLRRLLVHRPARRSRGRVPRPVSNDPERTATMDRFARAIVSITSVLPCGSTPRARLDNDDRVGFKAEWLVLVPLVVIGRAIESPALVIAALAVAVAVLAAEVAGNIYDDDIACSAVLQ